MINDINLRYFIYARKSTDTEDRQVRSIPDQLAEMRELAVRSKVEVADIFIESQTAKTPGRPVFNEMLSRIESGEAQGILAWHPDRLARNWTDGGHILQMLDSGGLKDLKFSACPFEPTSAGKYMLSMLFCQSKYYVDNLSDVVKRSFRQMLKSGLWPEKAPIGYLNDRNSETLTIDPDRGQLIRQAFELYASGKHTLAQLREQVSVMGLQGKKGQTLSISNVQYILKNPFYHGLMRFTGEYYEGKHPPLVTKALFDKVQAVMTSKSQPRHAKKLKSYLYRGLFTCAGCGCTITIETQKGHNYLRCTRKKGLCREPFVREEAIAEQIASAIGQLTLPSEDADWLISELQKEQDTHVQAMHRESQKLREAVRSKSGQIERLILALTDGTLSNEEFRVAKNRVILEKRELEEKAVTLERNRTGWLEPAIRFVNASKQAVFLTQSQNLTEQRDFFRKAGSNRRLTGKRVDWQPRGAWKTLVTADRLAHNTNAASCDAAFVSGKPDQLVSKLGD